VCAAKDRGKLNFPNSAQRNLRSSWSRWQLVNVSKNTWHDFSVLVCSLTGVSTFSNVVVRVAVTLCACQGLQAPRTHTPTFHGKNIDVSVYARFAWMCTQYPLARWPDALPLTRWPSQVLSNTGDLNGRLPFVCVLVDRSYVRRCFIRAAIVPCWYQLL